MHMRGGWRLSLILDVFQHLICIFISNSVCVWGGGKLYNSLQCMLMRGGWRLPPISSADLSVLLYAAQSDVIQLLQ